jgi:multidrug efflux pump subunit AcrB
MNAIVTWFTGNRVAAFLVSATIIIAGLTSLWHQKVEVFPEFSTEVISISVAYPGASPEEVEEGIVTRIEERIFDLPGIHNLYGTASEGVGQVSVQVEAGHDVKDLLDRVKSRVDAIDTLPDDAERPIVEHQEIRHQVIDLAIHGDVSERVLKRTAERVRDELMTQEGVTLAEVFGSRPDEITVEVSELSLRRYGITFQQVADAVRQSSLDLPAGNLRTNNGEVLLRTRSQAYTGHDFDTIPILTRSDGTHVTLAQVAHVRDGFAESDIATRFDGTPAVAVRAYRVGDQSALKVADTVNAYAEHYQSTLPSGVHMTPWNDTSILLRGRISLLLNNGWQGFVLVVLTLALFLRPRIAIWVALGIPVSLAGGLWLMPIFGISINMISLFAFILVLGIVVDDAIVVGENITHERSLTPNKPLGAARRGVTGVALAVTLSVMTTVAMFMPMLGIPGFMGKIWAVIPGIAIPVLIFSLFESLFILPAHLSHGGTKQLPRGLRWLDAIPDYVNLLLQRFLDSIYRPFIRWALAWRYFCITSFIGSLAITIALIATGAIPFSFFPQVPGDQVIASLTLPPGSSSSQTEAVIERLERAARTLQSEYEAAGSPGTIRHVMATVATRPGSNQRNRGGSSSLGDPAIGEVIVALAPTEVRSIPTTDIARRWREAVGDIPEAQELSFSHSVASAGKAIDIQLSGNDLDELVTVADALKAELGRINGVYGISDSNRAGKRELILKATPAAETLGLRQSDIARQVRQAVYGEEAQRLLRGRDEVKVMVRLPEDERASLGSIDDLRIRTRTGNEVPLRAVAEIEEGNGFTSISRADRKRIVSVKADVEPSIITGTAANALLSNEILPRILAEHPRITWSGEGENREMKESFGGLKTGFALALYACFVLMAILFRSILQPLVVISIIPFGLVGAVAGHFLMGMELSLMSFMGLVALAGIEVNDSIVLVDFINRARRQGMTLKQAVVESGCQRFRAILLTTLTTFFGLVPVIISGQLSIQARFLVPMAVALGFGGLFVTCITLVLVPSLYLVVEDVRWLLGIGEYNPSQTADEVEAEEAEEMASVTKPLPKDD